MKKNFLKKLAFTMAFATAFTALSPAAGVFAAKAPSLTVGKTLTLLLGTDRESHDINVNNKVKGSTYKWTTSNKAVATVNAKNGIVKGVKTGTAKVTLKITLPTKKTQTLTTTVNVKDNIKEVTVNNKEVVDNKLTTVLVAGQKFDFNRTIVSTFGGNTKAHKGAITRWEVLDADKKATDNASADDAGNFVATVPGKYLVSAVSFQSKAKYNEWLKSGDAQLVTARSEAVEVTVAASITSIKQTTPTELELTFDEDMSKVVNKDNLIIETKDAGKARQYVDKVTFSENGLKATVKVYLEFKHEVEYTVNVKDTALSTEFKASKGDAVSIKITGPELVVYNQPTVITYGIYDANGVRLQDTGASLALVEGVTNGYISKNADGKDTITIWEKDKSVVLKATFVTNRIDPEKFALVTLEDTIAIASREALPTVVKGTKYVIADKAPADWDKVTANSSSIALNDKNQRLFVQLTFDVDGKEVKHADGLTFESMDVSKLLVGVNGELVPIAAGTVVVKVTRDNLSAMIPVNVVADRKAVSWAFADGNVKTLSNSTQAKDVVEFKASAKDNYGADIAVGTIKVEALNGGAPGTGNDGVVKFEGTAFTGLAEGSYQYKVTYGDLTSMVTVVLKDGNTDTAVVTRKLVAENNATVVNTARNNDDNGAHQGAETVSFELLGYNKFGTLVNRVSNPTVQIESAPDANEGAGTVSGNAFNLTVTKGKETVSGVSLDVVYKAKAGTYVFKAVSGSDILAKTALVVEDKQVKATLVQDKLNVEGVTTLVDATRASFKAYVGSTELAGRYIIAVEGKTSTGADLTTNSTVSGNIVVTKVKVAQVFGGNVVIDEITVNRTVIVK